MGNITRCSFKTCYILVFTIIILGLASFTSAEEPSQKIDEASVKTMIEKAEPLIEDLTGMKFKERIKCKLVKREVVRDVMVEELLPKYKNLMKETDDDMIARQVETTAHAASQIMLGKYSLIKKEFLIVTDNVESLSKMFVIKDDDFQDFVFLVVAHEMVHALDDQYFDLQKKEIAMDDTEHMQAFGALVEGHAVYVTNKIAERLKLSETANKISLKSAAGVMNENDRLQQQIFYTTYVKGSEFVDAIINRKGPAGIAEAYASPPVSTRQIMNPEEYFNSSIAIALDCSKLLEKIASILPSTGMQMQSNSLGSMALSAGLIANGISEKDASAVANDCLSGAAVIGTKQTLKPKMMVVTAIYFSSRESAVKRLEFEKKIEQSSESQFKAQLNSSYTVVEDKELKLEGFDPVRYRHVEGKINAVITTVLTAKGLMGALYVDVTFINMQEISEGKVSEILTALGTERQKML
jgi:hypothetical protein